MWHLWGSAFLQTRGDRCHSHTFVDELNQLEGIKNTFHIECQKVKYSNDPNADSSLNSSDAFRLQFQDLIRHAALLCYTLSWRWKWASDLFLSSLICVDDVTVPGHLSARLLKNDSLTVLFYLLPCVSNRTRHKKDSCFVNVFFFIWDSSL